jgi:sodium-dependent phosphate transporter
MSLGTAFTVLFASKVGIPISTTHCMVGAVLCVGIARSNPKGVSWKTFRNILFAWLVTTPVAGLVSAGVAWLLVHFILGTY